MALLLCCFLFVALAGVIATFGYLQYVKPVRMMTQIERFSHWEKQDPTGRPASALPLRFLAGIGGLMPPSPAELNLTKRELATAGYRSEAAPAIFTGSKFFLCAVLLISGLLLRNVGGPPIAKIFIPAFSAVIGFLLPGIVLTRLVSRRQKQIRLALPDALDMLVVCCEAGSGLDQAILNVSREFRTVHPALSEELSLVNMEILAGSSRTEALRNLALRTGEEELKKLVAILVQTDRFGTSVADALRTQADFMRVRRRQVAEEKAAKVGVKLVFPIFFFCMPSLSILVMGPGLLQLMKNFLPTMNGMQ